MAASGTAAALQELRARMMKLNLGAFIVPSADPHLSEYVPPRFQRRARITGFNGSAGTAVVTPEKAMLWTDGRYWNEAQRCLPDEWELMKDGSPGIPTYDDWLSRNCAGAGSRPVGMDPYTCSTAMWELLSRDVEMQPVGPPNLIDEIFGDKTPELKKFPVVTHPIKYTGQTTQDKLAKVRLKTKELSCQMCFVSLLDDVAWLFNLRGNDLPENPVFYAYAIVECGDGDEHTGTAAIFVDKERLTPEALESLTSASVSIQPYEGVAEYLEGKRSGLRCAFDDGRVPYGIKLLLKNAGITTVSRKGIVQALKAVKNETEIEGFRNCHVRDGAALTAYLAWIENEVQHRGTVINEAEGAEKLLEFRKQWDLFKDVSFATISSSGANAAVVHYHPMKDTAARIDPGKLYLLDSGGQYLDGTTDVTRTVCFATPSEREREAYTLVLKGHIALNTLCFPAGTTGSRLDAFARQSLWSVGLDYPHGTGHGVGSYLCVHEGPEGISSRFQPTAAGLQKGMVLSNEPGYYKDGDFGIRIENLELVVKKETKYGTESRESLSFESLTMAPLCPQLIDLSLLTADEIAWVNSYHSKVREALTPLLGDNELSMSYLTRTTEPLRAP